MAGDTVSFLWKDYRHAGRRKVMTLAAGEFMRRFLLHVLPSGFHRIRHFGFLANRHRAARIALCRRLLQQPEAEPETATTPDAKPEVNDPARSHQLVPGRDCCPCCGSLSLIRSTLPRAPPVSMRP
jgi:hypothetical protein